jgi:hypothetical protein
MGSTTINTAITGLVERGEKLPTTVHIQEIRDTEAAYALILSKDQALELAHQLITCCTVMKPSRLILTLKKKSPGSISIVEY